MHKEKEMTKEQQQQKPVPPLYGLQGSPLNLIPSVRVIRDRIIRNSEEGRELRALYKIARRVEEKMREPKQQ